MINAQRYYIFALLQGGDGQREIIESLLESNEELAIMLGLPQAELRTMGGIACECREIEELKDMYYGRD
jgi:hypothetical protein